MRLKLFVNRFIVLILSIGLCLSCLCGCEAFSDLLSYENDDDEEVEEQKNKKNNKNHTQEPETMTLNGDTYIYEEPNTTSNQVGTMRTGDVVEYYSTKRVGGVTWYKMESGWFGIYDINNDPDNAKGHVVLSGFASKDLDLMEGAGTSSGAIGIMRVGSYVELYKIRDLWAQTATGWVLLDDIYVPGRIGKQSGWCMTLKDYIGCYSEPAFDSLKQNEFRSLQRVKIYEIIEIDTVSWGYTDSGWICLDDVYVEGTVADGACSAIVIDKTPLNVRIGPGTGYDVLRTLATGSRVEVLTQVYNGSNYWGFIGDGWIYMGLVEVYSSN